MDRGDLGSLEHFEGEAGPNPLVLAPSGIGASRFEPLPQSKLQDGGGVFREGHRRYLVEPGVSRAHERLDAVHEQGGLPGPRAGLEDEAAAEVPPRGLACLVVDGPKAHLTGSGAGDTAEAGGR